MYTVAIIPSTVGFHWEEVFAAYRIFKAANWQIEFYTINGELPVVDPLSIKKHIFLSYLGIGVRNSFSPESPLGKALSIQLNIETRSISELSIDKIDAIYIPGGHGCLFDVNVSEIVHSKLAE